jgi:tetratricopeptide (TPR) repeat protein
MVDNSRSREEEMGNPEAEGSESAADGAGETEDFYEAEVARYQDVLNADLKLAFRRYGFTLYHSLPPARMIELAGQIGFQPKDAIDHYNVAGAAIEREDFATASKNLKKAVDLDPDFADAVHNLALCMEKTGHKAEAGKQWQRYLELVTSDEDKETVQAHLAELSA